MDLGNDLLLLDKFDMTALTGWADLASDRSVDLARSVPLWSPREGAQAKGTAWLCGLGQLKCACITADRFLA